MTDPQYLARQVAFLRAVAHCEFLDFAELLELMQEASTAEGPYALNAIESRWRVAVARSRLYDLDGVDDICTALPPADAIQRAQANAVIRAEMRRG
jgi:hypothetical protein